MSNRIDRYCKTCGNVTVADAGYYAGSSFYHCETCGRRGMSDIFPKATVFHQITASPEVLAPKLVYKTAIRTSETMYDYRGRGVGVRYDIEEVWKSAITEDTYISEAEAIAATVARLKEVEK